MDNLELTGSSETLGELTGDRMDTSGSPSDKTFAKSDLMLPSLLPLNPEDIMLKCTMI